MGGNFVSVCASFQFLSPLHLSQHALHRLRPTGDGGRRRNWAAFKVISCIVLRRFGGLRPAGTRRKPSPSKPSARARATGAGRSSARPDESLQNDLHSIANCVRRPSVLRAALARCSGRDRRRRHHHHHHHHKHIHKHEQHTRHWNEAKLATVSRWLSASLPALKLRPVFGVNTRPAGARSPADRGSREG